MKEELIKLLIEAKGKSEFYYEKYRQAFFFQGNHYALHLEWTERVREIERQLALLSPNK